MCDRLSIALLALVFVACDDAPGTGTADGGGGLDATGMGGSGGFVPPDGGSPRFDARLGPDGGRLAQFREPCEDNLDCSSRWCVPFEDRNVCSQTCLDEGCPDNWGCHAVANTEPDVVFICFPPGNRLCGVCLQDADCPGGRCHLLDGQQVCGIDCNDDSTCPPGNTCEDVFGDGEGQCVPQTGSCTCDDSNANEQRICESSNPLGTCFGRETCDPERGWVGCNAPTPAEELCDQLDNDCNGFTDDIRGLGEVCEREADLDGETIACTGRLVCTRDTVDPVCTAPEPMGELCNFLDDDCDGETDEGYEERGEVCVVGTGQCQRVGVFECTPNGDAALCNTEAGAAEDELCDSLDNDCDGETDEDFEGLNDLCSVGVGACRRAGALRCTVEGDRALCTATPGDPVDEVCDGIDNDCDGTADEGFEGLFEPCSVGVGACLRQGFLFCTADGAGVECTADAAEPAEESCNGVDDDCDGAADEEFEGLDEPCSSGVGLCNRAGVTACSEDGTEVECNAVPADVGIELCNGLDDDCDGAADEAFPELDRVCEVGVGACARVGVLDCAPGGLATLCAARPAEPAEDVCDGLDNDCDGETDEGFPLRDRPCTDGEGLCERNGIYRCNEAGDDVLCDAQAADPADEICDGLDNDCDGEADEAFPTLDELCSVGIGACLRSGIRVCTEDGADVECNAEAGAAGPELCDGVDNNCDGVTDEGFDDLLTPCNVGVGSCLRGGVRVCAADGESTICNVRPGDDGAEVCDGLDNDCDGETDEGFADLGIACAVGRGVCERAGVRRCSPDGQAVLCDAEVVAPGAEVCDRLDNDCDGLTDEEHPALGQPCSAGTGACQTFGVRVCSEDGAAVECDAVGDDPSVELCDAVDNDCDGSTDEGFAGLFQPCQVGVGACLRFGVGRCSDDGGAVECNARPGFAVEEVCDRLDNNCDGETDEGFDGLGTACTVGTGACQAAGVRVCSDDESRVVCDAEAGDRGDETCDGTDDDCDGTIDEGYGGLGTPCSVGVGACQRTGVSVCNADADGVVCDVEQGPPRFERCDGLDNDCDGTVDEGYALLGDPCTRGVGACERPGVRICSDNGLSVVCNAAAAPPEAETCNGLDDDCDRTVDEGYAGLGTPCREGVGVCGRPGVRVCTAAGDGVQCNAVPGDPAAELCDSLDNNCNGEVDEGFDGLDTACSAGLGVCRVNGVRRCSADGAAVECNAVAGDGGDETCDRADDDCDGTVDEGFADLGRACQVGTGACLRSGVRVCSGDGASVECDAEAGLGAAERCDSVDNDCDGEIDEAFVQLRTPCTVGQGLCARTGVRVCTADGGGLECNVDPGAPEAEVCDGIDNDCDGTADEGFDGVGVPCSEGVGACRVDGVTVCADDGSAVVCNVQAGDGGAEVCDRVDNDCDGTTDEGFVGLNRPCSVGDGVCLRAGVQVCAADGSAVVCDAEAGAGGAETCDGSDNDCDGAIDEGFAGLRTACSVGTGACRADGVRGCAPDGASVVCDAQGGVAGAEVCDGIDNDCDGAFDEDFPGLGTGCTEGAGACLASGVVVCTAAGDAVECDAEPGAPRFERCDGVDNDCDGALDEGYAGLRTACSAGVGACEVAGVRVCSPNGLAVVCDASAGAPAAETCDGLDNDCDGTIDEAFPNRGRPCSAGTGACNRPGVNVCRADGAGVECNAEAGAPAAERCDGVDNDCDGTIDDGFPGLRTACSAGDGVCRRPGVRVCAADGNGVMCDAVAGDPAPETCDALDNDCDGTSDEGFAGLGTACSAGVGECQANGVRVCSANGAAVVCNAQAGNPVAEVCDGLDNDCDGSRDEIFAGLGDPCSDGVGACERPGVTVCTANAQGTECNAQRGGPVGESCNSIDDDCDGSVDEAFAGLGTPCTDGVGLCERAGVNLCSANGAGVECNAERGDPAGDVCDGLDNDCDGAADEDFGDKNAPCTVGLGICQRVGVRECAGNGGSTVCNEAPGAPEVEVCDGLDNDCQGDVDEAWPTAGQACNLGLGICRRAGVLGCNPNNRAGPVVCDAEPGAGNPAETCDYQDDDCDGDLDEGFVDGQGRYVTLRNCGACGTDCNALWNPDAGAFGVEPACDIVGGVAQCSFDCLDGFLDADGVPNNGCELEIDPDAIYVSTPANGGADAGACGTVQAPCATIGFGIQRADTPPRKLRVRVSDGVYPESITLVAGIDVLGGHHRTTWARNPALNVTIISGNSPGPHTRTVSAIGINAPTTLDGFVINGESVLADGNSYAVYVRDSSSALRITHNRVLAGDGGRGSDGSAGSSGAPGLPGSDGSTSFAVAIPDCGGAADDIDSGAVGGNPGLRLCSGQPVHGGAGGSTRCPGRNIQEGSGFGGDGPGGDGGAGAWGFEAPDANRCVVTGNGNPSDASPGADGGNGGDGGGGNGAAGGIGGLSGTDWEGNEGQSGANGVAGGGGGGGGGAAGVEVLWLVPAVDFGAAGGGGGSGGCHGDAGVGGDSGGGSFGIFVVFTGGGPNNPAGFPILEDNEIRRGLGGNGGAGGNGGGGGEGGVGGAGGPREPDNNWMSFCSFEGGAGGAGGRGGHGGAGGGGQGGASYDIFVANHNGLLPNYAGDNAFTLDGAVDTHGEGGPGGNSSNTVVGDGDDGAPGVSGNVAGLP